MILIKFLCFHLDMVLPIFCNMKFLLENNNAKNWLIAYRELVNYGSGLFLPLYIILD